MATGSKHDREARRAEAAARRAEQERAERRRRRLVVAVVAAVALTLVIPVAVVVVNQTREQARLDAAADWPIEGEKLAYRSDLGAADVARLREIAQGPRGPWWRAAAAGTASSRTG